ncbi:transposase [Streptomyces humidus]|uniref:transposase n=1 Tax=Streptomyces humidus TaxID=52259 RepID=UPI00332C81E3
MPEPWITDPALCRRAGIPQGTEFKTKPRQPMATPARAFAANVPFSRVTADEAYRQVKYLRLWLEAHDAAHVLVTWVNDTQVTPGGHEAQRTSRSQACRLGRGGGCRSVPVRRTRGEPGPDRRRSPCPTDRGTSGEKTAAGSRWSRASGGALRRRLRR